MPPNRTRLRACDVMTAEPVCVRPSMRIRELARTFEDNEISGAPVVDHRGRVIGIVSKTDLIRRCMEGTADIPPAYLFEVLSEETDEEDEETLEVVPEPMVCVEDFMTEDPVTVTPDQPVKAIAKVMSAKHIHRVIVVDEGDYPLGIITSMDLLRTFAQEQATEGPDARRTPPAGRSTP